MKIKSIKPVTLKMPFSHGGNKVIFHGKEWKELEFNLVRVETDKGIIGWGESFGYTSWKPVRTSIETMVTPLLVGKDMQNIPDLILTLQKSLHLFGRYGITMFAISGVEIALWDALGKEKNKPIHKLLGKKNKDLFKAYSSLFRYGDPKIIEEKCKQSLNAGYQAIKLHEVEDKCIEAGRKGSGSIPLMLDVNCTWTYDEAIAKKDFLINMQLHWLEEPIYPPEDYETIAKLKKELGIPIACGENACSEYEFKTMLNQKAISYAQPSVIKVGGIYEMYKIIQECEKNNVSVMPHSAYYGPGFLATLQLAALMKNETYIERFYLDLEQEFYPDFKKVLNGMYKLPSGPGLGMEFDNKILSKYEI
ncbi:MAG: mandelate racemase/muconate lactonizing enzyme family protein [Proteobacteria bacterium]|jgi:D-galactarolactone cycloisomerase|nr:mandelate racemase/muconate lactonizing enzyme family protein [Pseudomonadota bacterium]